MPNIHAQELNFFAISTTHVINTLKEMQEKELFTGIGISRLTRYVVKLSIKFKFSIDK